MADLAEQTYDGDIPENDGDDLVNIVDYDISVSPNDFNVNTIFDFIKGGTIKIPNFQRNYVWDMKRASKLIESLLIGVPIPQIFLYEEKRNSFLVIDGQQRLMTIYYFKMKKFPRMGKRAELRQIFAQNGGIPDNILNDSTYFTDFDLSLPESLPDKKNKFNKKNYSTLEDEDRTSLDFKTIRNIVVKQTSYPQDGNSVEFEIFNRLNSGGVNLKPQEIRTSLYHSDFYEMLYGINLNSHWRNQLQQEVPDLNMKDIEILLRGFAMLKEGNKYKPSMTKFLNSFSQNMKNAGSEEIQKLETLFKNFIGYITELTPEKIFIGVNKRFNISVFESIFVALCADGYADNSLIIKPTTIDKINQLKNDPEFVDATIKSAANTASVEKRLSKAKEVL